MTNFNNISNTPNPSPILPVTTPESTPPPQDLRSKVSELIKNKLGNNPDIDEQLIERWTTEALKAADVTKKEPKDSETVQTVLSAIEGMLYCVDQTEVKLLDENDKNEVSDDERPVYGMIQYLLQLDASPELSASLMKTILINRDPKFFEAACNLTQKILIKLYDQIQQNDSPEFNKKAEAMVGNILALLPFFNPERIESKQIQVPQKIGDEWQLVTFNIDRTPMEPQNSFLKEMAKFFGEPIDIVELDPVQDSPEGARSIRSFQGTTFPAGKGFIPTLLADTSPFSSIGEMFLRWTHGAFERSMNKPTMTPKADIYGQSLGGSTALLVSLHFPDKVENVATFGSPRLYSWTVSSLMKKLESRNLTYTPHVTCYYNENDSVPSYGNTYPPGTEAVRIIGANKHNFFSAHAKAVSGQKNVMMLKIPEEKTKGWTLLGVIHLIVSPIIFVTLATIFIIYRAIVTVFITFPKMAYQAIFQRNANATKASEPPQSV